MLNKVSLYAYLFTTPVDRIFRYDVLWRNNDKLLVKQTVLDANLNNTTEEVSVRVCDSLAHCIEEIIRELRNSEISMRVYKRLSPSAALDPVYEDFIRELCDNFTNNKIKSISLFGHLCKYKPQTVAKDYLKSMGYFILSTKPPHVYVLDDFVKKEMHALHH